MIHRINAELRRIWSAIGAGIILVVLAAAILAWNNGLATKIGQLVGQLLA